LVRNTRKGKLVAKVRSRIVEYKTIKASEIEDNGKNWRVHPDIQKQAMSAIFEDVGNIDVLKVIERDGKYRLIDGHLRKSIIGEGDVQVAVLDLSDEEADKALLSFDPVSAMAERDDKLLADLVEEVSGVDDIIEFLIGGDSDDDFDDGFSGEESVKGDSEKVGIVVGGSKFWVERGVYDKWQNEHRREAGLTDSEWEKWVLGRLGLNGN
jgi:hypothetical protein